MLLHRGAFAIWWSREFCVCEVTDTLRWCSTMWCCRRCMKKCLHQTQQESVLTNIYCFFSMSMCIVPGNDLDSYWFLEGKGTLSKVDPVSYSTTWWVGIVGLTKSDSIGDLIETPFITETVGKSLSRRHTWSNQFCTAWSAWPSKLPVKVA